MIPKFRAWSKSMERLERIQQLVWHRDELTRVITSFKCVIHTNLPGDVILMQSTGLKDKNGVEIFDGDVVKCYIVTEKGEYEYVGVVCLKDFAFVIVDEKDTYDPLWNYKSGFVDIETEIEIIGNIYENPELLEVNNV